MKKKNLILNAVMVALIAVIAVSGIMIVGNIKGWFRSNEQMASIGSVTGNCDILRSGVGYNVSKDMALKDSDEIETLNRSSASIIFENGTIVLDENTSIKVVKANSDELSIELLAGSLFVESSDSLKVTVDSKEITADDSSYLLTKNSGSFSLDVLSDKVSIGNDSFNEKTSVSCVSGTLSQIELSPDSLNQFAIDTIYDKKGLCFDPNDLQKVLDKREEERRIAIEEQSKHDAEVISRGGTEEVDPSKIMTCTISIRCDTILKNMDNLTKGKNSYVPKNGVILQTSTVQFTEGETVFDVLTRACKYAGIQIEYSWTPLYNSYYIEGINHLYEFDCGNESGWMYKVNGWFPNYGCSAYKLKDGDNIVWCYTCNGLGADVGGSVH